MCPSSPFVRMSNCRSDVIIVILASKRSRVVTADKLIFCLRYIAFLSVTGRSYGTTENHVSSIRHFHRLLGFPLGWDNSCSFQLALRWCKRFLGESPARNHPITPSLLFRMASLFDNTSPLQSAM